MKLTMDSGTVTCSLEEKNSAFLSACAGMFEGYLNGKLKINLFDGNEASEANVNLLRTLIGIACRYGIEIAEEVNEYYERLNTLAYERRRALEEEKERAEKWERLCKHGCGNCPHLYYVIDVPKCKETGEKLEEKNVPKAVDGVMQLFRFVAFPSENCPFNNKKQGV